MTRALDEERGMPREPDHNDTALMQYFVRGMRRFAKYVRFAQSVQTQKLSEADDESIEARIEAAYRLARSQFTPTLQP